MADSFFFESVLDKSEAFLCVIDRSGIILSINTSFTRIMGNRSSDSLVGSYVVDSVRGCTELQSFFSDLILHKKTSAFPSYIVQPIHRNGEKPLWIKFALSQASLQGKEDCIFFVGVDVTDEIVAKQVAEQQAHDRSAFIVKMGHDIRTPLNTVAGYAQLLHDLDDLPVTARSYAATIMANEKGLLHLLNDVLELSKYEAGETVSHFVETDIKKLIQETTQSYIDEFIAKTISLTVDYKTPVPDSLVTDPQKVAHVISNLIGNALKYTRKGGVSLSISCDNLITIDVEDTGVGMDSQEAAHVFDMLLQAEPADIFTNGSGISLALARIFARMLGGDVVLVRSSIDAGSLFRFTFEAETKQTGKKNVQPISDYTDIAGISRPCKVLLVDDVDINLDMLEIFLAPAGFEVSIAANGDEAVTLFRKTQPDIVFMDLIMPGKDGFEATREIKAINPDTPVIALTASIVDAVKEKALDAGVNDFMTKPFIPERFFEAIAEYTGITYLMKSAIV